MRRQAILHITKKMAIEIMTEILTKEQQSFDQRRLPFQYAIHSPENWVQLGYDPYTSGVCFASGHALQVLIQINTQIPEYFSEKMIIDDRELVSLLITTFHEITHARQHADIIERAGNDIIVIADLSAAKNYEYYRQNYLQDQSELDAEWRAIRLTKNYLEKELSISPEYTEQLMVAYIQAKENFLDTPYLCTSMQEINNAFKEAVQTGQKTAGRYAVKDINKVSEYDDAFLHIVKLSDKDGRWVPFWDKFQTAETREESDRMVLAVTYHAYPDDFKLYEPRLSRMDLSPNTVFGISKWPETAEEIQDRNPDYVNKLKMSTKNQETSEEICPVITDKDLEGLEDNNGPVR